MGNKNKCWSSYTGWPVPQRWEEAADSITYDSSRPPPITLVCGPGNSGKSTFSRILLNKLLQRYKSVGYLDTDVGQPEFGVPGSLSLHVIDLTILCVKKPERCFFFGDVTAQKNPKVYLNYIFRLYDHFINNYYKSIELDRSGNSMLPLVINTSGWVKGVGFSVLVEMLRYTSPTHVVHIRVSAESNNLPTGFFWLKEDERTTVDMIQIPAVHDSPTRSTVRNKDARNVRDLRLVAYFRQCLPKELDISSYKELKHFLASIPAYKMPISRIKLNRLHRQVPSGEIDDSLIATIVGLAISVYAPSTSARCSAWCVGFGIVRSVDKSRDGLYVVTPVSPDQLEKVDILLRGCLETPECLLQSADDDRMAKMKKPLSGRLSDLVK